MDINHLRIAAMLLGFAGFLWLVVWTWSRKRRAGFDDAARLPFVDTAADGEASNVIGGNR